MAARPPSASLWGGRRLLYRNRCCDPGLAARRARTGEAGRQDLCRNQEGTGKPRPAGSRTPSGIEQAGGGVMAKKHAKDKAKVKPLAAPARGGEPAAADNNKVGYGRPPRHTRFKKGQC